MDWIQFPTLNSLRAFTAVAETLSISNAAASLNVTHAAVSQQVKALEDRISNIEEAANKENTDICRKREVACTPWAFLALLGIILQFIFVVLK